MEERADRFPPLLFLGPSLGIGRALTTFDGGGAVSLSICFSILSLNSSPYVPMSLESEKGHRVPEILTITTVSFQIHPGSQYAFRTNSSLHSQLIFWGSL